MAPRIFLASWYSVSGLQWGLSMCSSLANRLCSLRNSVWRAIIPRCSLARESPERHRPEQHDLNTSLPIMCLNYNVKINTDVNVCYKRSGPVLGFYCKLSAYLFIYPSEDKDVTGDSDISVTSDHHKFIKG